MPELKTNGSTQSTKISYNNKNKMNKQLNQIKGTSFHKGLWHFYWELSSYVLFRNLGDTFKWRFFS